MFQGKTILVVDDEPDLREILKDEFSFDGAQVAEAENGKKALDLVKSSNFDLVVSDIRMPGGDGVTLAKSMKGINPVKPALVLITGFADLTAEEAYDFGVEGFVTKPFNLAPIREIVQRLMTPTGERWNQKPEGITPKTYKSELGFEKALEAQKISIGRGGMYINGDFSTSRVNDWMNFELGGGFSGLGVVRWVRSDERPGLPMGVGIEFFQLNPEALKMVEGYIEQKKPAAFIPRH